MPYYGSQAFRDLKITIYLRKTFLSESAFDQVAIAVAHELSHVILDSLQHPLRSREMAVDLTAMLLGFRRLYASGAYKVERLQKRVTTQRLGYLTQSEVLLANRILARDYWWSRFRAIGQQLLAPLRRGSIGASASK